MHGHGDTPPRKQTEQVALIAAYRAGLGLARLALIRGQAGARLAAMRDPHPCRPSERGRQGRGPVPAESIAASWWCRCLADAERLADATNRRLRRLSSEAAGEALPELVQSAAQRLNVALYSDDDIVRAALPVIARIDEEIERLRRAGRLRAVNNSYRAQRIEASLRGEKVAPYAQWFNKYRANLVRQAASALRFI
jgi:hypothetical protein